jgi:hypothetical protein
MFIRWLLENFNHSTGWKEVVVRVFTIDTAFNSMSHQRNVLLL